MLDRTFRLIVIAALSMMGTTACSSSGEAQNDTNVEVRLPVNKEPTPAPVKPLPTPRIDFTAADVAKLKWIEGTWRGMDGEKPFYERYKIESGAMIVQGLKEDGSADGEPGRFELKNGEFGKGEGEVRSAASEITDTSIQFVPSGKGNSFRFEKQPHGWDAILEWPATAGKPARSKTYNMEPWVPEKK